METPMFVSTSQNTTLQSLFGTNIVFLQQLQKMISNGGRPQLLTQGCVYRAASQMGGTFPLSDVNRGRI